MSNPRDDRYFGLGKSRSPPPTDSQGGFFQTGQGGRTVLPPLSSAFPTSLFPGPVPYSNNAYPHPQPRPSSRYDYNNNNAYNQWSSAPPATGHTPSSYPYYPDNSGHDPRYNAAVHVGYGDAGDHRKLPPLSMPQYNASPVPMHNGPPIRSPTAAYPTTYNAYGQPNMNYNYAYDQPPRGPMPHNSSHSTLAAAIDPRPSSPYNRSIHHAPAPSYSPPPISPTSQEEPAIKKKRKRADANQLKILTETYNRTAFPSTEERMDLARRLEMTPRSVQIWFQNRRQSMRQTRQSSANTSNHQPFQAPNMSHEPADEGYDAHYVSDAGSPGTSHRRVRQDVDPRKAPGQWRSY